MKIILIVPAITLLVYILYSNGFMFYESKTALTFRGIQKKGCFGAKFRGCSGVTKKVIRIKEEKEFTLTYSLEKGSIYVKVKGRDNSGEYSFDNIHRHTVPAGKYTIITDFDSASGSYMLEW